MFGGKQKLDRLSTLANDKRGLLTSDNVDEMKQAVRTIQFAWGEAGYPMCEAIDIARELEMRVDNILRRPFEERIRPCPSCQGRLFRISGEQAVEGLGKVRVAVCEGCRAMTMFWIDLHQINTWGPVVAVYDGIGGPFR